MPIYCDESGGVSRGVMTLAALFIDEDVADALLARFREVTGLRGELKGSRIKLGERALIVELLEKTDARAAVSIALSATQTDEGASRGAHDIAVYASLMDDAVSALLPATKGCSNVIMDDGRYGEKVLEHVRREIAAIAGPWNTSSLVHSDKLAGLQLADVLANSFYNRARVSGKQARIAAILQPMLDARRIEMRILGSDEVETLPANIMPSKKD
ncbi:MAG: DUF3800 domain-containing protein [Sphingorhabdus sp.]